jgi:VWFA-related protein
MLIFLLLAMPVMAQQDAAAPEAGKRTNATSGAATGAPVPRPPVGPNREITLDVVVTDKAGKPVTGLQEQDFTVLDDKLAQKVDSFRAVEAASAPLRVILLMDAVNTSFQAMARERQEIEKFLRENNGTLAQATSVAFFTDKETKILPDATRDGNALADLVEKNESSLRIITRSQGFYGAADRLNLSLKTIGMLTAAEGQVPGKKLVIWVSPGWPILSGPNVELSQKDQEYLFNEIVELSTELREADITLYSVDPLGTADAGGFRTFYYKEFVKGVKAAKNTLTGNLALQVLAYQSGGRVLNSNNDIAEEVASCVMDANAYYLLTFDSPPPDGPVQYHDLQVKVGKDGLTARTRTGYYALK